MIAAAVDDFSGRKEQDHITDGGAADIYVEYNGEQDEEGEDGSDSASDFENEMQDHMDSGTEEEMPDIMTAEDVQVGHQNENLDEDFMQQVFIPNDNGVITTIINSPLKRRSSEACNLSQSSQVCNPSQPTTDLVAATTDLVAATTETTQNVAEDSDSDNSDDNDYVPHTDDSGEESEILVAQVLTTSSKKSLHTDKENKQQNIAEERQQASQQIAGEKATEWAMDTATA
ncbi:hypothetical protein ZWY2020_047481 [Hordeum vulgare]|nr:hypothetical protein ZWY2020_047481 [Hordeum vulgare]